MAFLEDEVLELAFARLIANRAIERMIDQQEFQHTLARVLSLNGLSFDDHAFSYGGRTCDLEFRGFFNLDQTHATHARDGQSRVVAIVRDEHTRLLCRLDDERAGRDAHGRPVDREVDELVRHR